MPFKNTRHLEGDAPSEPLRAHQNTTRGSSRRRMCNAPTQHGVAHLSSKGSPLPAGLPRRLSGPRAYAKQHAFGVQVGAGLPARTRRWRRAKGRLPTAEDVVNSWRQVKRMQNARFYAFSAFNRGDIASKSRRWFASFARYSCRTPCIPSHNRDNCAQGEEEREGGKQG